MRYIIFAVMMIIFPVAGICGNLNPPSGPADIGSAMFTIQDVYYRLTLGSPGTKEVFSEPSIAPGPTGHTLDDLLNVAPSADNTNGAGPENVLSGRSYWGLRTDGPGWGLQTGSMPNIGALNYTPRASDQPIAAGYHNGGGIVAGDSDLVAGNIVAGVNIFGVTGNAPLAIGNARSAQVLETYTFSSAHGSGLTGSMPNRGAINITPSTRTQYISAGYHNGSGRVAGDADLVPGNIASGRTIFGVAGSGIFATGSATDADVRSGITYSSASSGVSTGTMPVRTLSAASSTVDAGYYNATNLAAVDPDLAAGNISSGITLFGVTGSATLATGLATDADVRVGVTYSSGTGPSTGTMPTQTLDPANDTVAPGYYAATTLSAIDIDLAAVNIANGVNIFGVGGTALIAAGTATAADVLTGVTFSNSSGTNVDGGMTNVGVQNITPGDAPITITEGYHDGTGQVAGDADLVATNIVSGIEIFGIAGSAIASPWPAPVPVTGQTTCYNTAGNVIACGATGQDGEYQAGISIAGRFTTEDPLATPADPYDDTVTDNMTGLMWARNSDSGGGRMVWSFAVDAANASTLGGYTDWRLPNIRELMSLLDYSGTWPCLPSGHPFIDVRTDFLYWTSTTLWSSAARAWTVSFSNCQSLTVDKGANQRYLWFVRDA